MWRNRRFLAALGAGSLLAGSAIGASAAAAAGPTAGGGAGVFNGSSARITNPCLPISKFAPA